MEEDSEVLVRGEEPLVQIEKLVVVLHQQLQTYLTTTGCTHGLVQDDRNVRILPSLNVDLPCLFDHFTLSKSVKT